MSIHFARPAEAQVLSQIIDGFNALFGNCLNTRLEGGFDEPLYRPANAQQPFHSIQFTYDYVASALHEISHWCVAGEQRRKLIDYGYWYAPDGRSEQQQREFELVEVKPQAYEWLLSRACQLPFRLSVDNLHAQAQASLVFKQAVAAEAQRLCRDGAPERLQKLLNLFSARFSNSAKLDAEYFTVEKLA